LQKNTEVLVGTPDLERSPQEKISSQSSLAETLGSENYGDIHYVIFVIIKNKIISVFFVFN
jgi:hypothetical protein